MQYLQRLLKRQAQIAARLEQTNAPMLRLYPQTVWIEAAAASETAAETAAGPAVQVPQVHTAEEMYHQLTRLEAVREQRIYAAQRMQEVSAAPAVQEQKEQVQVPYFAQGTRASSQQVQQSSGALMQMHTLQLPMERISRFFERDARRYGG